ncbi:MAG TPA: formyltransferase family protein [Ferruginibacter sp.]|nr:formyltransferase family protein [Ferruginibacter sp.]HRO05227.1 formyltransferase family protein [Ferruginibacter sp.]HRO95989.1 formyltransferase family protein [Ferruginibacter sp.]HRP48677.1 formyltransferase family protein [Ferruginibacter sp.]
MIVVLTFDKPHRKTQDLVLQLLARGYKPMVVAREYVVRKNFVPIIPHRPSRPIDIDPKTMCKNLALDYVETHSTCLANTLKGINGIQCILLASGNIVEAQIVQQYRVLNAHPAWLPDVKGLDALKWSIYHDEIIGVTTHRVNEEIDSGILIERKKVPVFVNDTFHMVAYRQYEMEISMLIDSISAHPEDTVIGSSKHEVFRRMPHRIERELMHCFDLYKAKHAVHN